MPSFTALLFVLGLLYVSVFLVAATYRNVRFGNKHFPHPYPFRLALASAAVETFLTPPLTQHRTRMTAMRHAEARRAAALAQSMGRHPAGTLTARPAAHPSHPATAHPSAVHPSGAEVAAQVEDTDQFAARARATHVADQVTASFHAAKAIHPATRARTAAAKAAHPASTGRATGRATVAAG